MTVDSITLERDRIREMIVPVQEAEEAGKPKKKKDEKVTMKSVLCKMVPYASFPYADHILRTIHADPNAKIEPKDE